MPFSRHCGESPRAVGDPPGTPTAHDPLTSTGPCVTRNSKSAHQLIQNTQAGILSLSFGVVQAVVARASARFIEVVIEIDTPAHTLAVAKAHKEMMADCAFDRTGWWRTLP